MKMIVSAKMSSLGQMTSELAHAISNPLTIIQGKAAQLRDRASRNEATSAMVKDHAERIEQTVMRIGQLVRSTRMFARDGSNDPFETVPVRRILEDTVSFCGDRFQAGGIPIEVFISSETLRLECRPVQISEVILNLLNNSYDALLTLPNPWVKLCAKDLGDKLLFSITDSGPGIPIEIQARVMQPFFTTKAPGKGTGLGLSIANGIVHAHQGSLFIDNENQNTRFNVLLPWRQRL
jgi:C4-dicarboxylate-specific signal transduction histidine kinase